MNAKQSSLTWKTWMIHCIWGEVLGFTAASFFIASVATWLEPDVFFQNRGFLLALRCTAGLIQGGLLGYFQTRSLKRVFPSLRVSSWSLMSAAGGVLCWLLASLPPNMTLASPSPDGLISPAPPEWIFLTLLISGFLYGAIFGAAQWLILRAYVRPSKRWIFANALGISLSSLWFLFGILVPSHQTPTFLVITLSIVLGGFSGITFSLITWQFLKTLLPVAPVIQMRPAA